MNDTSTLMERLLAVNENLSRFIQKREGTGNTTSKKQVTNQQEKESTTERPNQNVTSIW